jgi:hypothetical protein
MRAKSALSIIVAVFFTLLSGLAAYAQAPEVLWTKIYGGSDAETAWQSQETQDGGFVIVGSTESYGEGYTDVYLIRTDENGDTLWTKTYGGASTDEGRSVKQTADGGFIVVGFTESYGDYYRNVYLIKTDGDGDTAWTRTYGTMNYQEGRSIVVCDDGGYIIAGWRGGEDDVYVIRTDSLGNELWYRTYVGYSNERAWSVIQTADGGYAVAGWTESTLGRAADVYVIKMNDSGDSLWSGTYGDIENDEGRDIVEIPGRGYAVAGKTFAPGIMFYLIRIDNDGDLIWERTYGEGVGVICHSLARTYDDGYVLAGYNISYNEDYVVRTNADGDTLWTTTVLSGVDIHCRSVVQTSDGGYAIAGNVNGEIYMAKLASDQTGMDDDGYVVPDAIALFQNHPNPFNASTVISYELARAGGVSISIYDIVGQHMVTLYEGFRDTGEYSITWDATDYSSGVYFARLQAGSYRQNVKMVLLK